MTVKCGVRVKLTNKYCIASRPDSRLYLYFVYFCRWFCDGPSNGDRLVQRRFRTSSSRRKAKVTNQSDRQATFQERLLRRYHRRKRKRPYRPILWTSRMWKDIDRRSGRRPLPSPVVRRHGGRIGYRTGQGGQETRRYLPSSKDVERRGTRRRG